MHYWCFWHVCRSLWVTHITLHVCVHILHVCFVSGPFSSMHGTVPLTGKSGLSNVFAGVFEPCPTLCTCMHTLCVPGQFLSTSISPGHGLVLPEGECGSFEFAGHALMLSCMSPAIFACAAMPCMSVQCVHTISGLNFAPTVHSLVCLEISDDFRHD